MMETLLLSLFVTKQRVPSGLTASFWGATCTGMRPISVQLSVSTMDTQALPEQATYRRVKSGVAAMLDVPMSEQELVLLKRSANEVRGVAASLGL
jgi:hypothetical protein